MKVRFLRLKIALIVAVLFSTLSLNRASYAKTSGVDRSSVFLLDSPAPVVFETKRFGVAGEVFDLVNQNRSKRGARRLRWHDGLAEMASDYSRRMAKEDFFSHFDPDGNSVVDRAYEYDITNWKKIGENLFASEGYVDPTSIAVRGWLKSRTHRRNMLDRTWTHTGVGVYRTRDKRFFITQVFMRR